MGVLLMAIMLNLRCSATLATESAELAATRFAIYTERIMNNIVHDFVKDSPTPLKRYIRNLLWLQMSDNIMLHQEVSYIVIP